MEWLKLEYDIDVSVPVINKRIRQYKKMEQEARNHAIREVGCFRYGVRLRQTG